MDRLETIIETVLDYCFRFLQKISGLSVSSEKRQTAVQFAKFALVGLSNTFLSYFIYLFVWQLLNIAGLKGSQRYLLAQAFAFVIGVFWSFYWNNKIVFTSQKGTIKVWSSLIKTFLSYSFTGLFLNSILLILWVQMLKLSELLAPLLNLIISVPINFILNKYWTFD